MNFKRKHRNLYRVIFWITILAMLFTGIPAVADSTTASFDPVALTWTQENIPTTINNQLAPGTNVAFLTVASNGDIFAVDNQTAGANVLYKSVNGGFAWTATIPTTPASAPWITAGYDVVAIAVSPTYATDGTVFVLASNGADNSRVYMSNNGGNTFSVLGGMITGAGTSIAIAPNYASGVGEVMVGTVNVSGVAYGDVYIWGMYGVLDWTVTSLNRDVTSVTYSPHFTFDGTRLAVGSDSTGTHLHTKVAGEMGWDNTIPIAAAISTFCYEYGATTNGTTGSDIAVPEDFDSTSLFTCTAYVCVRSGGNDNVYRQNIGSIAPAVALSPLDIYGIIDQAVDSLVYSGDTTTGELYAGVVALGSPRVMKCTSPQTGTTSEPPAWTGPIKNPSGNAPVYVALAADYFSSNQVYAGTSGSESAVSVSNEGGNYFYQAGLIDTLISIITNFATGTESEFFLATSNNAAGAPDSLWKTTDGGVTWFRTLSIPDNNNHNAPIIRLSPNYSSEETIVISEFCDDIIMVSHDGGDLWSGYSSTFPVGDMVVKDHINYYVGAHNGNLVSATTDGGLNWAVPTTVGTGGGIDYLEIDLTTGDLLAGTSSGSVYLSTDDNNSYLEIGTPTGVDFQAFVYFDTDYANNNFIYALWPYSSGNLYRWQVGSSTDWSIIRTLETGFLGTCGLETYEGSLYMMEANESSSRCSWTPNPTESDIPSITWYTIDPTSSQSVVFCLKPLAITAGYGKLWAIDTLSDGLYSCEVIEAVTEVWVDDDWAGLSLGDPVNGHTFGVDAFAKIQDGIYAVADGGTVRVAEGTYNENIVNHDAVSYKAVFLIGGYSSDFSTYDPNTFISTIYGNGSGTVVRLESGDNSVVKGFDISNGSIGISIALMSVEIAENDIHGNAESGISMDVGNAVINDNDIHGNNGDGIILYTETAFAEITGNRIFENDGHGIKRGDTASSDIKRNIIIDNMGWGIYAGRSNVENNLIAHNSSGGLCFENSFGTCMVMNNTIAENKGKGIMFDIDLTVILTNNIIWSNTETDLPQGSATYSCIGTGNTAGHGNISLDPKFFTPASNNFTLQSSSPCIDTGTNTGAPVVDINSNMRPVDADGNGVATTDMGAYEIGVLPSQIWVDDYWSSLNPGDMAEGHIIGIDAFAKIQDGINAVLSGGTVKVTEGTYNENIINRNAAGYKAVSLIGGYSSDYSIYNPDTYISTIHGNGTGNVVRFAEAGNSIVQGFKINNGSVGISLSLISVQITDNDIYWNTNEGIYIDVGYAVIENNDIHFNNGSGITLDTETADADIIGNRIFENFGDGIRREDTKSSDIQRNTIIWNQGWGIYANYANVENNVIAHNSAGGICLDGSGSYSPKVTNNTIVQNTGEGIDFFAPDLNVVITNNIIWNNTIDLQQGSASYSCIGTGNTAGPGNISINPKIFSSASNNFTLQSSSPCIDTGTNTGAPLVDIEGNTRPVDGEGNDVATTDMGAYETGVLPNQIMVDDDWTSLSPGDSADGHIFGIDAFAKIQDGINAVLSGGTVQVAQGTYNENIINRNAAGYKAVTLIGGYSGNFSDFNPDIYISTIQGSGTGDIVRFAEAGNSTIRGFRINNGSVGISLSWISVQITDNDIYSNTTDGIYLDVGYAIIENNDIHFNNGSGITLATETADADIIGNRIFENSGNGISRDDTRSSDIQRNTIIWNQGWGIYANYANLENNLIAYNSSGGVWIDGSMGSARVVNNTIANNTGIGVRFYEGDINVTITNDVIWGNTVKDLPQGTATYSCIGTGNTTGPGNISLDPKFFASASNNFTLQSDSPCIDTGTDTGAPVVDIKGNTRPVDGDGNGTAITDMGAYEFVPVMPSVNTVPYNNLMPTSVTLNGYLENPGSASSVGLSFVWGSESQADPSQYPNEITTVPSTLTGPGTFSADLYGLIPNTPYFYRAKAVGDGTVYGIEGSFITTPIGTETTVGVNSGDTISLIQGGIREDIPITINGIPSPGLGAFQFDLSWDKDVIYVDNVSAVNLNGVLIVVGDPDNDTGTVTVAGFATTEYPIGVVTVATINITAVGNPGNSTSINVTVTTLIDEDDVNIPASSIGAPVEIINLTAETGLFMEKANDGVIVISMNVTLVKDPGTGETMDIPGGISSFAATATTTPESGMQFLDIRPLGIIPDPLTGGFGGVLSPSVNPPDSLAKLISTLSGNCTTPYILTIAVDDITAAGDSGLHIIEEHANSLNFLRGDTNNNGNVDISDAMYIAQYIVKKKTLEQINALNAASVKHDTGGDKIDISDAMYIAQYVVKKRDAYFNLK